MRVSISIRYLMENKTYTLIFLSKNCLIFQIIIFYLLYYIIRYLKIKKKIKIESKIFFVCKMRNIFFNYSLLSTWLMINSRNDIEFHYRLNDKWWYFHVNSSDILHFSYIDRNVFFFYQISILYFKNIEHFLFNPKL